jgi:hypothetical protein
MRIRMTSFAKPPLPKELYFKLTKIKYKPSHWVNRAFYGTGDVNKAVEYVEKEIEKEKSV